MISLKVFQEQTERLQKAFKDSYSKEQLSALYGEVKGNDPDCLVRATKYLINSQMRLPPNLFIINAVQNESLINWEKEKEKEDRKAQEFFAGEIPYKGEMAKEALQLCFNVLTVDQEGFFLKPKRKMTKKQLYENMLEMEKKYPGIGWEEEAFKMVNRVTM